MNNKKYKSRFLCLFIFVAGMGSNSVLVAGERLVNGGFDSIGLNGWDVTSGKGVDRVCDWGYYVSAACAVDMNNTGSPAQGEISQTFETVSGGAYSVSYWIGGNAQCQQGVKTLTISVGGFSDIETVDTSAGRPAFRNETFGFTATGNTATLTFTGDTTGSCGAMIDSVSVIGPDPIDDADGDGVADEDDACADSANGAAVDSAGCSVAQLCPCEEFNNHGGYVSCTSRAVEAFVEDGLLSDEEGDEIVSAAAHSCKIKGNNGKAKGR